MGAGPHLLDLGDVLYAPNCFQDAQGRRVMLAWLQELRQGGGFDYAGCISLPRVLSYKSKPLHHTAHVVVWRLPIVGQTMKADFAGYLIMTDSTVKACGIAWHFHFWACVYQHIMSVAFRSVVTGQQKHNLMLGSHAIVGS